MNRCSELEHVEVADHRLGFDKVLGLFPDPWSKRRQEKHRLICREFLDELARILAESGLFKLVTDDFAYMESATKFFLMHEKFKPVHPSPHYVKGIEGYGQSTFQELWQRLERTFYSLKMVRRS